LGAGGRGFKSPLPDTVISPEIPNALVSGLLQLGPVSDGVILSATGEVVVERGSEDVVFGWRREALTGGDLADVAMAQSPSDRDRGHPEVADAPTGQVEPSA
jgi:hypothetical protein